MFSQNKPSFTLGMAWRTNKKPSITISKLLIISCRHYEAAMKIELVKAEWEMKPG
jgi:hypothetical protein